MAPNAENNFNNLSSKRLSNGSLKKNVHFFDISPSIANPLASANVIHNAHSYRPTQSAPPMPRRHSDCTSTNLYTNTLPEPSASGTMSRIPSARRKSLTREGVMTANGQLAIITDIVRPNGS